MIRRQILFFILFFSVSSAAYAQQNLVTIDLAQDHVDITTGFTGARLVLYGVREGEGDIAIVIKGPARDITVRQKKSVGGAWINRDSVTFTGMPSFYDYALSNIDMDEEAVQRVSLAALSFLSKDGETEAKEEFKKALIRNKRAEKLYPRKPKIINFLNDNFFKAEFYLPANVPVGDYQIQTFYFTDNVVSEVKTTSLKVAQVGFNAQMRRFSLQHPFIYGFLCVGLAIFAGWFSNRVRRRA